MQFESEVCLVVIKETGPGKYSILLCDPQGSAHWCLPFGDVMEIENEEDVLQDPDDLFPLMCLHYLNGFTGLDEEVLDDGEVLKYSFNRVAGDDNNLSRMVYSFWTLIDKEKEKAVEKVLKKKKGNVQFFPYADGNDPGLPEMLDPLQRRIITQVMGHFHHRDN